MSYMQRAGKVVEHPPGPNLMRHGGQQHQAKPLCAAWGLRSMSELINAIAWRIVSCAPNYEVSNDGQVRRATPGKRTYVGRLLTLTFHSFGYPTTKLTINGKHKAYQVHRLVAIAFLGDPPFPKAEVCHLDGNPKNNDINNLIWASHKENESHKAKHGTAPRGERNGASRLTWDIVRSIRADYGPMSLTEVGKKYGVTFGHVSDIVNFEIWKPEHEIS